jgi:hypothetical protein
MYTRNRLANEAAGTEQGEERQRDPGAGRVRAHARRVSASRWLGALVTALAMGCEHGIDLVGDVRVPALPDDGGTRPRPAQLVMVAALSNGTELWTRPEPWCEAPGHEADLSVSVFEFGCAVEGTARVTAWVYAADAPVDCANPPTSLTESQLLYESRRDCRAPDVGCPPSKERILATTTARVKLDVSDCLGGCCNASIPVSLKLVPVKSSP